MKINDQATCLPLLRNAPWLHVLDLPAAIPAVWFPDYGGYPRQQIA